MSDRDPNAVVLLTNRISSRISTSGGPALPLRDALRVYTEHVDVEVAARYAIVVTDVADADVALLRLPGAHGGAELDRIVDIAATVPTVAVVDLYRPTAVVADLVGYCAALLGTRGADDEGVLDIVFGRHAPAGRLSTDLPCDAEPLFETGHGLSY
jgi:beta-glucosidase